MDRQHISSGTPGERQARFTRAVRVGETVYVSGTTATDADGGPAHPGDAGAQARFILDIIQRVLEEAGSGLGDVVRTRIFLRSAEDADAVAKVHAEVFGDTFPANTLVLVAPLDPAMLLEIEADAVISASD